MAITPPTPAGGAEPAVPQYAEPGIFTIRGRIGRVRYFAYAGCGLAVAILAPVILGALAAAAGLDRQAAITATLFGSSMVWFGVAVMAFIFAIRRFHDFEASGWLVLLFFVPIANVILGLVAVLKRGSTGANRYGPPPPPNSARVKATASGFFVICFLAGFFAGPLSMYMIGFVPKSGVYEALDGVRPLQRRIEEFVEQNGRLPSYNEEIQAPYSDPSYGSEVELVTIKGDALWLTFKAGATPFAGKSIRLQAEIVGEGSPTLIGWNCTSPDIDPAHLPTRCKD